MDTPVSDETGLTAREEVEELERQLLIAKHRLEALDIDNAVNPPEIPSPRSRKFPNISNYASVLTTRIPAAYSSQGHFLFLLSDSALPLGAFAFSSGLESYQAHKSRPASTSASFASFLPSSLSSYASTTLPFVLSAHRDPLSLAQLDDELDAATICTVGRRASVAQGRALLSIWERSFKTALTGTVDEEKVAIIQDFATVLRETKSDEIPLVSAHLGPLFGVICALVGLDLEQTAYIFMMNHVKALISAGVRASMFGPYQAQKVLASGNVQQMIQTVIQREWATPVELAGQAVPMVDLWIGRHELLYSRIFNS